MPLHVDICGSSGNLHLNVHKGVSSIITQGEQNQKDDYIRYTGCLRNRLELKQKH